MFHRFFVGTVLIASLAAAACGSDDDSDVATTQAPTDDSVVTDASTSEAVTTDDSASDTTPADTVEEVKIYLPFPASIVWYPLLLGDELGFFAEESIDVELVPGSGDLPAAVLLEQDQVDVACVNPGPIFEGIEADVDIRVIYEYWQTSVFDVVVPADSDIETLADLSGRTIGISSDVGGDLERLLSWLDTVGLSESDVTTAVVGDAGPVLAESLSSGRIDAHAGSISDFVGIEANGTDVRGILPEELKVTPSCVWATLQSDIDENADVLERFLRAWAKGTAAGLENRDVIEAIARNEIPEEWENPVFATSFLDLGLELQRPVTDLYGELRPDVWTSTQEQLGSENVIDPAVFLDDRFIGPANEFSLDQANEAAEAYRSENL